MFLVKRFLMTVGLVLGIFPLLTVEGGQIGLSSNLSEEDRVRLDRLKLSDITMKGLRCSIKVNKTKTNVVEHRVYTVLKNFTKSVERLRRAIISLRDEVASYSNSSNIRMGDSWKEVFNHSMVNVNAELYAVTKLTQMISACATMVTDFFFELRMKPVDKALLENAIHELESARDELVAEDSQTPSGNQSKLEKIPDATHKFEKVLVIAHHYLQTQLKRLENSNPHIAERLLSD